MSQSNLSVTVSATRVKTEWDFKDKIIFQRVTPVEHIRDSLMGQYALQRNGKPFSTICEMCQIFHVPLSDTFFWRKHTPAY